MTKEILDERIKALQTEQNQLSQLHTQMVSQFQKNVAINQTRYAQITGAITELIKIQDQLNGENPI